MRLWDIDARLLCRQHLLASWREGLAIWAIVNSPIKGGSYRQHPEVKRWLGNHTLLYAKLETIRAEMLRRGYKPKPMPNPDTLTAMGLNMVRYIDPIAMGLTQWQSTEEQIRLLRAKRCKCEV